MKALKTVLILLLMGSLSVTVSLAGKKGKSFKYWAEGDKAYKKVWFGPAPDSMKRFNKVGFPKRVGLISVYIFDTGSFEFSAMARTYGGTYQKTFGLNKRGANEFSSQFAKRGVPALKKQFAEFGMELVTPVEFLETDEQKRAYIDFKLPEGGLQKFTKAVRKVLDKNPHASGAADGFKMIPVHLWTDKEILRALDELRITLGLDGLAVLSNFTSSNKKSVMFSGAALDIYGPNPDPEPEKYAKYWTPSILYSRGTFGKGVKGFPFAFWKKGVVQSAAYEGYEVIINSLAKRTLDEMQKAYDKGK